jgi:heme/copper-type cytochrome/quinol oxidase subunit 4
MKKTKKSKKKDDEGYYGVSFFIAIILTLLIHWLFLSRFNFHSTIHVAIGIGIFATIITILSSILKRFW